MNKKLICRKAVFAMLACTTLTSINAQQKEYPQPERMKPGMSEYWTPQPAIVTPGDIQTNSAPSDAIVLFDGKDLSAWESVKGGPAQWTVENGVFTVNKPTGDIQTKQQFENFQLHIEWRIPEDITGTSQGRGNSGVFLQGKYEIQVLDCYNNETYVNGQTGSVYKQTPPLANAMRKPSEWNVYDIIYSAPIFKDDNTYRVPPTVTVIHNGVVLQNHTTILGTTEYIGFPKVAKHGAGPIILQSHGDPSEPISFRNIWIREL
ncbi:DUF1080 domain-containing protein [Parabacteroides sp. PF5-9]|uniref:3-keto-disaccharide hydrolase n=1 Tax=Parabacteroides sp. PF5-9 TaxID=1742404 RepID=UPI0024760B6C|nr:DUF1080 domain-containing protein [Parabacteroides sp. PF5-9]MDH6358671.1 hypothetical protein [Parabacteroides sp. PF5-9]